MQQAAVSTSYSAGVLSVRLTGEIDHHSAASVRETIDRDLYTYAPRTIKLMLGGVEFMDSSGIGLILGRYTRLKEREAVLLIEDPTPQVERILVMAGIDRLIRIVRTNGAPDRKKGVRKS
ncbi:MAG: anti-sigma factor antagonist [Clostridia bacterium]|nr:anti-sigma factor antagonist [Clostridia bacterium]